jgi:hypothetical protein
MKLYKIALNVFRELYIKHQRYTMHDLELLYFGV